MYFPPVAGERLEQLATKRRGPLRWSAALVLGAQARADRGRIPSVVVATGPATVAAAPPEVAAGDALRLLAAVAPRPDAEVEVEPCDASRPLPMPGSGWSWSPDDEQTWGAWEAADTAGGADLRLAALAVELECPLPAAVRWAQRLKISRPVSGKCGPEHDGDTDQG